MHAHGLDLFPVNLHVKLGRPGAEAVEQADEAGLLVALGGQVVGLGLERVKVDVAGGFHHQLEAARVAEAAHGRRAEDDHTGVQDFLLEARAETAQDGFAVQPCPSSFVERLEDDEHGAVVRAEGVQHERLPRDSHGVSNPGRLQGDLLGCPGHLGRALQRGRVGQLDVGQQIALVLRGNEAAGNAREAEARQADQADVDQENDRAEAERPADGLAVGSCRPLKDPVEAPEEMAQCPVHRPDQEPPERPPGDRAGEEEDEVHPPRQQGGFQVAGRHLAALLSGRQAQPGAQGRRQQPRGRQPAQ